jgi:hypothetical protein
VSQLHTLYSYRNQLPSQGVKQPVSRRVQQQAKLVGQEAAAAQAVGLERQLEILDPVLALAPSYVPVVESLWLIGAACDHKAGILALLQTYIFRR